jgi:CheY-like chemotaxis protein
MTKKILIVDDESLNRDATASTIKRVGYQVEQATSGLDALKKFIADHYDVILMDQDMPLMDGYQCTKKIREYENGSSRRSVIIGIISTAEKDTQTKCLEAGMDACFDKTGSMQDLQRTVRHWALIA